MSFLSGTKNLPTPPQKNLGLSTANAATNEQGAPLFYLAGKRRFAGTFLSDAFDQVAIAVGGGGKDSGKGGGGQGTNYYAGCGVAFCHGPCDGFHDFYLNGDPVYTQNTPLIPILLSQVSNLATFETANPHGVVTGQTGVISGADQPEFNGIFTFTVISPTEFTYTIPGSSLSSEIASGPIQCFITLDPVYRGPEDGLIITVPDYGLLGINWGTQTANVDPYLAISGANHPPYRGIANLILHQFFLGLNQYNFQNAEAIFSRVPAPAWLANPAWANISDEANPACVFYDLLTKPLAGLDLVDADFYMAGMNDAAEQFYDEGLGVSPLLTRQDSALSFIQQLCQAVDMLPLLNGSGLLYGLPVRPPADYTALLTFTDSQLAALPTPTGTDWSTAFTYTRLTFPNRDANYNNDYVEWQDFGTLAATENVGQPQTLNLDWITRRDIALKLVAAYGPTAALPQQTGKQSLLFTPALWAAAAPGTVFRNAFANPTCARANGVFRVTRRRFTKSAQPVMEIEYAADRSYLNVAL